MCTFIWTAVVHPQSALMKRQNENIKTCWVSFSIKDFLLDLLAFNDADYGKEQFLTY